MNTLRARLIATFLIVAVVAVGVVGLISVTRARQAIIDAAWKEGDALVSRLSDHIDSLLVERATVLELMAGQQSVRSMEYAAQQPVLMPLYDQYNFSDIFVVNLEGDTTDVKLGPQKVNIKDRDYFIKAVKETKTVISQPAVNRRTGMLTYFYASPIVKDGTVVGVLVAGENIENVAKAASSIIWGTSGYAYVTDSKGVLIAHPQT